jgi:hypothetical protein
MIIFQNALVPFFAPGILYNSIKSGVAVDYPLVNGFIKRDGSQNLLALDGDPSDSMTVDGNNDFFLSFSGSQAYDTTGKFGSYTMEDGLIFDRRVPFEALINPDTIKGTAFYCQEPHPLANHSSSAVITSIAGDRLYSLMMNNFVAETTNFFMKRKNKTTFVSKPSNELLHFESGKDYMMRVKMFKTTSDPQNSSVSGGFGGPAATNTFNAPQYSEDSSESFTMYSRPTAFGPPSMITSSMFVTYSNGMGFIGFGNTVLGNKPYKGENYPFTPPYYHGQAWADITFTPDNSGQYTVKEILNSSSVQYYRYVDPNTDKGSNIFDIPSGSTKGVSDGYAQNNYYNKNALQLSASVNLFQMQRDQTGPINEETARWVIQTKWETPILNFNHYGSSSTITLPLNASQSVPRGMWHQYGNIEQDSSKGIFIQIDDVEEDWLTNILDKDLGNIRSLSRHMGFQTGPARLGEIADEATVSEAIVAVPFIEESGLRKFFHLKREDIDQALEPDSNLVGESIQNMVNKMQKYVFPPSMDFVYNNTIDPFAMYIFEFSQALTQEDLADIWQGLYPKSTEKMETASSTISHRLLAKELLGGGADVVRDSNNITINDAAQGNKFRDKIRWMVFKVKQRGKNNYFESIVGSTPQNAAGPASGGESMQDMSSELLGGPVPNSEEIQQLLASEPIPRNTYNWPYDFCSIVELAKIETTVTIGKVAESSIRNIVVPQGATEAAQAIEPTEVNPAVREVLATQTPGNSTIPQLMTDFTSPGPNGGGGGQGGGTAGLPGNNEDGTPDIGSKDDGPGEGEGSGWGGGN